MAMTDDDIYRDLATRLTNSLINHFTTQTFPKFVNVSVADITFLLNYAKPKYDLWLNQSLDCMNRTGGHSANLLSYTTPDAPIRI